MEEENRETLGCSKKEVVLPEDRDVPAGEPSECHDEIHE